MPDKNESLFLVQVGFQNGRQALFQTVFNFEDGTTTLESALGKFVVFIADDGVDVGILRAAEPLFELVRSIPEVPYTRMVRLATAPEILDMVNKEQEEKVVFRVAEKLLRQRRNLESMKIRFCEFQFDRKKLILFVDMKHCKWVGEKKN